MNADMAMKFGKFVFAFSMLMILAGGVQAQENIRVMCYNLLRYGAQGIGGCTPLTVTQRNSWFTDILSEVQPDIFGVNEIGPFDGPFSPHANVSINVLPNVPGKGPFYEAAKIQFSGSQDICNMMWYNSQKVGLSTQDFINVTGNARNLDYYKFYYKAPEPIVDSTFLHVVVVHFMASNAAEREQQATAIMTYFGSIGLSGGDDYMVMGDMNLSTPNSGAFQAMVNAGSLSLNDPLNITSNWTSSTYDYSWSQSTRSSAANCGSGGGLDDRFDVIICSDGLMTTAGNDISYIPNSYWVVGNPHSPNPPANNISADLVGMSDHFPVVVDLEVSKVVGLSGAGVDGLRLFVANPISGELKGSLNVPGGLEGAFEFSLVKLDGRKVWEEGAGFVSGDHSFSFDLQGVSAGVYLFLVEGEHSAPLVRKMILMD